MRQTLQSQRFTLRLDEEIVASMSYLMANHPFKYQSHTDLIRQAISEYLASRINTPATDITSVKLPSRTKARLLRLADEGFGEPDQIIKEAVNHYSQVLLEDEALFDVRVEQARETAPKAPKVAQGLMDQ